MKRLSVFYSFSTFHHELSESFEMLAFFKILGFLTFPPQALCSLTLFRNASLA